MLRNRRHPGFALWALAFTLMSCAASGGNLKVGMTPDQAIAVMGQPDLKDTVPDPRGNGAGVLRYAWVAQGKVATFGADDRLAQVADLPAGSSAANSNAAPANTAGAAEVPESAPMQSSFDPIQTPLNYLFYPLKFGLTWVGAGINCVAEGSCHRPEVKPPDAG